MFVGHTSVLSGAELCLLDTAPHFPDALVCLFADGPLAHALRASGVEVEILGAARSLANVRRSAGLLSVARSVPAAWALAREIARLTRPEDIIYANTQKSWVMLAIVAWQLRRSIIWHLHDVMSAAHFNRPLSRVAVLLANRLAAAVIVNSEATRAAFIELGGRPELLHVIYNGIDPAKFASIPPQTRAALRAQLGLGEHATVVGLFGRITPWKGQHVLLDALRRLPDVYALIVGDALFGEDAYRCELERLATDPALSERVKFLGFRNDVPELMQAVDIVVHTSAAPEPFGRVIVEAMLARRPVVATAMGGVLEIVDNEVDGLLVPPNDPVALARAIDRLATTPALRGALTAAGYRKASERFAPARVLRAVEAVIDAVVARTRGTVSSAAKARAPSTETCRSSTRGGRVLFVSHSAEISGAELSLLDIATRFGGSASVCLFRQGPMADVLRQRGVRVEILDGSARFLDVRRGVQLASMLRAIPSAFRIARLLHRFARSADIVYANSQKAWIVAAVVGWWQRKPVVWHLRDILSAPSFGRSTVRVAVLLANRVASRVLVNSTATGDAFVAAGGRRELVRVVHNGIDAEPFDLLRATRRSEIRREIGLDEDVVVVGLFGRIASWKGQRVLLTALEHVPDVTALIVGDALFGEQEHRHELERLADRAALRGRVALLGHRSDVPALMKAVDIVVHASTEPEPFGRVIVEGMFAERPVIAVGAGGVVEIITDGVDGLLVKPNDPEALAAAIKALVADPARARRLALAGRQKAEECFSVGEMHRRIAAELQELVPAVP